MTHHPYPPPRTRPVTVRAVLRLGRVLAALVAAGVLAVLVAGVPYGLSHWIGWPLPHHVPTTTQIKDTLTGPFTDRILLDTLACLCWILWAVFLTDLAQAIPDTLHNIRQSIGRATTSPTFAGADQRSGPLRGLAALLLATIVAGLVSLRPHPSFAARSVAPPGYPRPNIVTTVVQPDRRLASPSAGPDVPTSAHTAVVQPPRDGIHDSLWRIAQRYLGNGARWPEIYRLSQGDPQPGDETLSSPSLIQPGWITPPADEHGDWLCRPEHARRRVTDDAAIRPTPRARLLDVASVNRVDDTEWQGQPEGDSSVSERTGDTPGRLTSDRQHGVERVTAAFDASRNTGTAAQLRRA